MERIGPRLGRRSRTLCLGASGCGSGLGVDARAGRIGGRRQFRRGDSRRTHSSAQDVVVRPGHGAGAHRGGWESARSHAHAHHVVHGDAGVDGQDANRKSGFASQAPLKAQQSPGLTTSRVAWKVVRCSEPIWAGIGALPVSLSSNSVLQLFPQRSTGRR
jgi:hypothetical protein